MFIQHVIQLTAASRQTELCYHLKFSASLAATPFHIPFCGQAGRCPMTHLLALLLSSFLGSTAAFGLVCCLGSLLFLPDQLLSKLGCVLKYLCWYCCCCCGC